MKIKVSELENIALKALSKNYSPEESKRICDVVMFGQMSGKLSHGINRLTGGGEKSILTQKSEKDIEIVKETPVSILVNGNGHPGLSVLPFAINKAIEKVKSAGFVVMGTNGTYNTSGCLSYYLNKIAQNNLIGIVMSRASRDIAPFGSIEPIFGTNPIGFAIPCKPQPFIFDMATSAISYGALMKAKLENKQIAENLAIDSSGKITTNPQGVVDGGAILPFDRSYKGSGLAMVVEILAGCLVGASFVDIKQDDDWGNFIILLKPDLLTNLDDLKNNVKTLIERTKQAKRNDGQETRIPGETTLNNYKKTLELGEVEVDDNILSQLKTFAQN